MIWWNRKRTQCVRNGQREKIYIMHYEHVFLLRMSALCSCLMFLLTCPCLLCPFYVSVLYSYPMTCCALYHCPTLVTVSVLYLCPSSLPYDSVVPFLSSLLFSIFDPYLINLFIVPALCHCRASAWCPYHVFLNLVLIIKPCTYISSHVPIVSVPPCPYYFRTPMSLPFTTMSLSVPPPCPCLFVLPLFS